MNETNITFGGKEAAADKPEAQQWISVSVTYLQTDPDGRKKKESLEMLVDEKFFGLAEKTAKCLLRGREKLFVTGCRRRLIAALLEAAETDGGQDWPTYEAQTAYQTASGAEIRRNWIVLAPSFHAAIDTVDWHRHPVREKLVRIDERPDLVVVMTGRTYQQTDPINEEL